MQKEKKNDQKKGKKIYLILSPPKPLLLSNKTNKRKFN